MEAARAAYLMDGRADMEAVVVEMSGRVARGRFMEETAGREGRKGNEGKGGALSWVSDADEDQVNIMLSNRGYVRESFGQGWPFVIDSVDSESIDDISVRDDEEVSIAVRCHRSMTFQHLSPKSKMPGKAQKIRCDCAYRARLADRVPTPSSSNLETLNLHTGTRRRGRARSLEGRIAFREALYCV